MCHVKLQLRIVNGLVRGAECFIMADDKYLDNLNNIPICLDIVRAITSTSLLIVRF